ncbi:MAG: hypothetical protein V1807_02755, partial [Patescibacteria group bacterium]
VSLSQLPDWLEAPHIIPRFNNPVSSFSYRFQHWIHDLGFDARQAAPWGLVAQTIITAAFLLWALV